MMSPNLIEHNGSLDGTFVTHRLKTLLPLLDPVHLIDNSLDIDLARVKVINSSGELVGLRETAEDSDLITD
jgi:hypothetical protein